MVESTCDSQEFSRASFWLFQILKIAEKSKNALLKLFFFRKKPPEIQFSSFIIKKISGEKNTEIRKKLQSLKLLLHIRIVRIVSIRIIHQAPYRVVFREPFKIFFRKQHGMVVRHFVEKTDDREQRRFHVAIDIELFVSVVFEPLFIELPVLLSRFYEFIARHVDC